MPHQDLQNKGRVGQSGCFNNNVSQFGDAPGLQAIYQAGQRLDKITAYSAAKAAVRKFYNTFILPSHKKVVYADFAENNGCIGKCRFDKQPVQQCPFA